MEQGPMSPSSLGRKSPRALRSPTRHYPLRLQTKAVPRSRTHNTVRVTQRLQSRPAYTLDYTSWSALLKLDWFSVVMSSIGSGLFSRLSRNSVRERLSPLLGEGFSRLLRLWVCDPPTSVLLCEFLLKAAGSDDLEESLRKWNKPIKGTSELGLQEKKSSRRCVALWTLVFRSAFIIWADALPHPSHGAASAKLYPWCQSNSK